MVPCSLYKLGQISYQFLPPDESMGIGYILQLLFSIKHALYNMHYKRCIAHYEWKGINRKQCTRWQHLSRWKASAFFSLQNFFSCYETQQLILGTSTAIWWVTEPHCTTCIALHCTALHCAALHSTPNTACIAEHSMHSTVPLPVCSFPKNTFKPINGPLIGLLHYSFSVPKPGQP
jgi:hypothetical protein